MGTGRHAFGIPTFMRKKVMLVSRSTVDLRSCSRSGLLAGKLFCWDQVSDETGDSATHCTGEDMAVPQFQQGQGLSTWGHRSMGRLH